MLTEIYFLFCFLLSEFSPFSARRVLPEQAIREGRNNVILPFVGSIITLFRLFNGDFFGEWNTSHHVLAHCYTFLTFVCNVIYF